MKSARRDSAAGVLDRIGGRVLEVWGSMTGRSSHTAKGKAARGRGAARRTKGGAKRSVRR
jgi:uncharacterized protein YjbJ (UPF0337 family)